MKPELVRNSRQPRTNLNLKRNYIPKTLEQECLSRVRISHKFHGLFCLISVWMFMFSRRSAVASAFTALQCVEVFTMCEGLPRETAVQWWCLWVPLPFLCQSSHSQSALICPRNRAEKCTKGYLRWQLWSRDICPTLFVEKLTSTMRSICLLYCVLFQWDVESIMDNS